MSIYKEHDNYPFESVDYEPDLLEFRSKNIFSELINECLLQTNGLALEIGGPTEKGYLVLDNVEFPNGLVISNAYPDNDDVAKMDVTTRLPFDDDSIGCVISSCLPVIDLSNPLRDAREISRVVKRINLLADDILIGRYDRLQNEISNNISPRIALIRESCRVLEPNGILIIKSLMDSELRIIKELGFVELASAQHRLPSYNEIWMQKEYIFKLHNPNRLKTIGEVALNSHFDQF